MPERPSVCDLEAERSKPLEVGVVRGGERRSREDRGGRDHAILKAAPSTAGVIEEARGSARLLGANRDDGAHHSLRESLVFRFHGTAEELPPRQRAHRKCTPLRVPAVEFQRFGRLRDERANQEARVEVNRARRKRDHGRDARRSARISLIQRSAFSSSRPNRSWSSASAATTSDRGSDSSTIAATCTARLRASDFETPQRRARRSSASAVSGSRANVARTDILPMARRYGHTSSPSSRKTGTHHLVAPNGAVA